MHASRLAGAEIENDPDDNPCFGCGPRNEGGLRLRFFDDGEVVRAEVAPRPAFAGWTSLWNPGLVVLATMEVGGWAVWERLGPSTLAGSMTVHPLGQAPLAHPLLVEARVKGEGPQREVEVSTSADGKPCIRATWPVRALRPEEAQRVLAFPALPRSMRPGFEERAAGR